MIDMTSTLSGDPVTARPNLDYGFKSSSFIIAALLMVGIVFTIYSLSGDISQAHSTTHTAPTNWLPYVLLGVALLIALGFEFVNGFHDTANAVATVIYTNSMPPHIAVIWAGIFNFLGVLLSSGVVAFGIISLLPVELILQVGTSAGFAMVFALLIAAILWNLGTWFFGLPASSSHTLIGSILGVGLANALMHGRNGTSGIDWAQVSKVGYSLLLSPAIGFVFSALVVLALRVLVKNRELYEAPKGDKPPPLWIRSLLILTCTGVSFTHGSNDGQKGMGLIMLILIGTVPMAYALNRSMPVEQVAQFAEMSQTTQRQLQQVIGADTALPANPQHILSEYVRTHELKTEVLPALAALTGQIGQEIQSQGSLATIPADTVADVRNDMYLAAEAIRFIDKDEKSGLDKTTKETLQAFRAQIDTATKFIPVWVKVAVAIALGLGTMVGWKRIVITVGEKIGKSHLTYAQGASAEFVAMATIGAADVLGLSVSTTHVLSSGIAGTMVANRSGLQKSTVFNLLTAWVLTLPAAILLSGGLYWLFTLIF